MPVLGVTARGIVQGRANPYEERRLDYEEARAILHTKMAEYRWDYRKTECRRCPLEERQKLQCTRDNIFRIYKDTVLHATNCGKMENAVFERYRSHMAGLSAIMPVIREQAHFI